MNSKDADLQKVKKALKNKCIHINNSPESRTYFKRYLDEMVECNSYQNLQDMCKTFSSEIDDINIDPHIINVLGLDVEIDTEAAEYMPFDLPEENLYPLKVHADGNCLPSTASIFRYGNADQVEEMRVRIILELVQNEDLYLKDDFLELRLDAENAILGRSLKKQYAQYSESFIPGQRLTEEKVRSIFRQEVPSVTRDKSFMGIWQIHALSSVLKTPIFSVYPNLGNSNIRKDLNRLIKPVIENEPKPLYLMWTSNRDDLTVEHWVPNHFVPLVAVLHSQQFVDELDENNNSPNKGYKNLNKEECSVLKPEFEIIDKSNDDGNRSDNECDVIIYIYDTANTEQIENEHQTRQDTDSQSGGINVYVPTNTKKNFSCNNITTSELVNQSGNNIVEEAPDMHVESYETNISNENMTVLQEAYENEATNENDKNMYASYTGKHVVVNFKKKFYVGFVEEVSDEKLLIECMRKIGKRNENLFSWPKKIKDKNWYSPDDVVSVVYEIRRKEDKNKFMIDEESWKYFLN